ncbi:MAG: pseudouridine-5'-phosphate glycosidase [Planctomycetia bacterium]|nr:pseudouridine-5'-phosphate glycosidase [Planctomycetia bacterium]
MRSDGLMVADEVWDAIAERRAVVALESTLIAHGLPWPTNLQTAREAESAIRALGAVPATIAIWNGVPTIGLTDSQLEELARASGVRKASRRDLGAAIALKQLAATTVSATMALAHSVGIRVFATGGIGGAHRAQPVRNEELGMRREETASAPEVLTPHSSFLTPHSSLLIPHSSFLTGLFDVSSDLTELARTPVLVVCAGAKSILDLPRTLEILETLGVPVMGYRTDAFPAFYVRDHEPSLSVSARVDSAEQAADVFAAHVRLGGKGAVLAQPCPEEVAVPAAEFDQWLIEAEREASAAGVVGAKLTPFLLARLAEFSGGRTLAANRALIVANARLAAEVSAKL